MGIFCQINLFKPPDGAYRPGQIVAGLINYAVDEPIEVDSIITSLKGHGTTVIKIRRRNDKTSKYTASEVYVDIDNVIQDTKTELQVSSYETKFSFKLPENIPSSLKVFKRFGRYRAHCSIKYYIRIKFNKSAFFSINKHFKKEITVVSDILNPSLLMEPVMYGEQKKIIRPFSKKNNIINTKANIFNSIVPGGGKIELNYEVENDSSITVKSTETKLIEVYKFITPGHRFKIEDDVLDSDVKTSSIKSGCKLDVPIEINIPSDIHSIESSAIISRYYKVRMVVELPMPHFNSVLDIPVQIGTPNCEEEFSGNIQQIIYDEPPPSYWEAMGEECEKEKVDDVDDDS